MKNLQNYLELNGKIIVFLNKSGVYWIALKPICEALNINFHKQFDRVKTHPTLGAECTKQDIQVPGDQTRKFICLSEEFIYGWLFSIQSDSAELLAYQRTCYHLLYQYFHGTITQRKAILEERNQIIDRVSVLAEKLSINNDFVELNSLRAKNMRMEKDLKKLDEILASGQTMLEFNN
jgi:hypothetical protein